MSVKSSKPLNHSSFLFSNSYFDGPVKSNETVMPDLIRHPEALEITGFRLSPE